MRKQISELKPGDLVDLENDPFADKEKHPEFEFEYQEVETVDVETPEYTAVYFVSAACVGFPPSHVVEVADEIERSPIMSQAKLNPFQVAAAKAYGGGDYSYIADESNYDAAMAQSADVGDTLFTFIMRELANDPGDVMESETARQRMESAIRDVQTVIDALPE
jgi:hypothetical protein